MKYYLSLDIGGSKYIVGLIDREGHVLQTRMGVWQELTRDGVLQTVLQEARTLLRETGVAPTACGITIPGLADPQNGIWVEAQFSGIRDFPICDALSSRRGLPCYCDNAGQAYAIAEMIFGCCKDVKDFIHMNVSNGIGGALVCNGKLVYGSRGNAGEFGHCVVVEGGRPCKCGTKGCLEMYAAGPGIARSYAEAGGRPDENGEPAQAKLISERARAGEQLARDIFVLEGKLLGGVIAKAVNILNPAKVILGGGVSMAFDLFGPSLRETVREQIYNNANPNCEILPTPLKYLAGLYGGAAIAVSRDEHIFD